MSLRRATLPAGFYLTLFAVGIGTSVIHESAHWVMGTALGYEMLVSPNHVWSRMEATPADAMVISAAGPIVTIVQGLLGFLLVKSRQSRFGFAMLYMAFFTRFVAMGVSVFNPNDEARIGSQLGIGMWTAPALVVALLFGLVYLSSRRLKLGARDQLYCFVVASIVVTLVVGIDRFIFHRT
jgi:hypothetical protein